MSWIKKTLWLLLIPIAACTNTSKMWSSGSVTDEKVYESIEVDRISKLLIMEVEIEGKMYRFLFDTGAPNVIDTRLQGLYDYKRKARSKVSDSQGKQQKLDYVLIPEMSISDVQFSNTIALVADLRAVPELACFNIDGILGANLMRFFYWMIEAEEQRISFSSDLDRFELSPNAFSIPFKRKVSYTPMVDLKAGELEVKNATFDTGSGGKLSLYVNWFELDSMEIRESYGYHSAGLYGRTKDHVWYTPLQIQLDSLDNWGVEAVKLTETRKMLLGMEYLERYTMVLDWKEQLIYLDPKEDYELEAFVTFGFTPILEDERLRVGSVIEGSGADSLGLKVGFQITRVNNMDCSTVSGDQYCEIIEEFKNSKSSVDVEVDSIGLINIPRIQLFN